MANCTGALAGDIINDCTKRPIGGLETDIYLFNRKDVTISVDPTNRNKVVDITVATGKRGYKYQGFKKTANAGYEMVGSDTLPNGYNQKLNLVIWGVDSASVKAQDEIDDVVAVVENKNKGIAGDGAFEVYGDECGLYKTVHSRMANDNGGSTTIELSSNSGEEASVSRRVFYKTSYAVTKSTLEDLMTIQE